jgi:hypothetical protein
MVAGLLFYPEKIFNVSLWRPTLKTLRSIKMADLVFELNDQFADCPLIRIQVEMLDFLTHDPVGHRVDVVTKNIAPYSIRFEERRSPTHKGVSDTKTLEIVGTEESFS